jgi:phosphoenolpyruvate carboxylase
MGFFDSEIVQQEAKSLFEDYQALVQLGGKYGKFDREGKKQYIDQMEAMMERYRIFMKRFELSEDFMAQMTVKQLNTQFDQFGITPQQMFDRMYQTLEGMKAELERNPY